MWLYGFYLFDRLAAGYWSAIALCGGCYAWSVVKLMKDRDWKASLRRFFTPAMVTFALVMLVVTLWAPSMVTLWDDLRHWAAVPKVLYYTQRLQLGENSRLWGGVFNTYLPGMPLFQYFFAKTRGVFLEKHLFVAYSLLTLSVFLPALKRLRWKDALLLPFAAAVILFVPQAFANQTWDQLRFYTTLYIEPALGIFFGFGLFHAYCGPQKDWLSAVRFALGLAVLTLLKDTGIVLALFCLLSAFWCGRGKRADVLPGGGGMRGYRIRLCVCCAAPVLVWAAWKIVCGVYGDAAWFSGSTSAQGILEFVLHPDAAQAAFARRFLAALYREPLLFARIFEIVTVNGSLSFLGAFGVLSGMGFAAYWLILREKRCAFLKIYGCWACAAVVYVIGLFWLYLQTFDGTIPSFSRYVSVLFAGYLSFLAMIWLVALPVEEPEAPGVAVRYPVLLLSICMLLTVFPCGEYPYRYYTGDEMHAKALQMQKSIARQVANMPVEEDAAILLLLEDTSVDDALMLHHHLMLDLYGDRLFMPTYLSGEAGADEAGLIEAFSQTAPGCRLVYAAPGSERLTGLADAYFDSEIVPDTVYSVTVDEVGVHCLPVQQQQ